MNQSFKKIYDLLEQAWLHMTEYPQDATEESINVGDEALSKIASILDANPALLKEKDYEKVEIEILRFNMIHRIHVMDYNNTLEKYVSGL